MGSIQYSAQLVLGSGITACLRHAGLKILSRCGLTSFGTLTKTQLYSPVALDIP